MSPYAERTAVSVERSEQEIKRILQKIKAEKIGIMSEPTKATIYFAVKGRDVQLVVPLVRKGDAIEGKPGYRFSEHGAQAETRRRWRVMVLTLKAMLEAIDAKIVTFDQVFLAHVVVPGTGRTIGEALLPRLGTNGMRALMGGDQ